MDTQILQALNARDPARALALADQWLLERPGLAQAQRLRALALAHGGDYAAARTELEALLARVPDDARAQLILAQVLLQLAPELAAERFATAAQLDPNLGLAHVGRADTELRRGDLREAESLYRTALRADTQLLPALIGLCQVLSLSGRHEEAVKIGHQAVQAGPESALALTAYGRALAGNGNAAFAEQAFRRALEVQADYLPAEHQLLMMDMAAGRIGAAARRLDSLLGKYPQDPQLLELKGDLLRLVGQHDAARLHYEHALATVPGNLALFEKLIAHLFAMGQQDEGLQRLADAARAQPRATPFWHGWLSALLKFGRPQEALATVLEWQQVAAESVDPQIYETAVREFTGDLKGAAQSALTVVERAPGQPLAVGILIREALGRRDGRAALRWLTTLDRSHLDPAQQHRLLVWEGCAHDLIAERPQAMHAWQRAVALVKNDPLPRLSSMPTPHSPQSASIAEGGAEVIYLVGLPGSGTAPLANLLHAIADVGVLTDRLQAPGYRQDFLTHAEPGLLDMDLATHELAHHAGNVQRLRRQLAGTAIHLVDWLAELDLRVFQRIAAAEPDARWIIVQRDPRDCLLQLFAVGSGGLGAPITAADRLARQQAHLAAILALKYPKVRALNFDALQRDPNSVLKTLSDWLGLALPAELWPELLKEGGGYPVYLPPQHWVAYVPELREAFGRCAPQA
ncbi:MAG: tetratricopeptide repeat protein [Xanthomonadales bacterium]|jgi:tetratricopeptide (TPR) repeat protein|nr:tetratricopeptide repeat protein [Xanthomonadales bacterium]